MVKFDRIKYFEKIVLEEKNFEENFSEFLNVEIQNFSCFN